MKPSGWVGALVAPCALESLAHEAAAGHLGLMALPAGAVAGSVNHAVWSRCSRPIDHELTYEHVRPLGWHVVATLAAES